MTGLKVFNQSLQTEMLPERVFIAEVSIAAGTRNSLDGLMSKGID